MCDSICPVSRLEENREDHGKWMISASITQIVLLTCALYARFVKRNKMQDKHLRPWIRLIMQICNLLFHLTGLLKQQIHKSPSLQWMQLSNVSHSLWSNCLVPCLWQENCKCSNGYSKSENTFNNKPQPFDKGKILII